MQSPSIEHILEDLGLDNNAKNIISNLLEYYKTAAYIDSLTNAYNKRFLYEKLQTMSNFYACMIDINNFKGINDQIGHVNADLILTEMSKIFQDSIDNNGYVIRFGGDEFVIIIQEKDLKFVQNMIKSIKLKISEKYYKQLICPTISYGIAYSNGISKVIDIIRKADENMYKSRQTYLTCIQNIAN